MSGDAIAIAPPAALEAVLRRQRALHECWEPCMAWLYFDEEPERLDDETKQDIALARGTVLDASAVVPLLRAVIANLEWCGPCDEALDGDPYCQFSGCVYCAMGIVADALPADWRALAESEES